MSANTVRIALAAIVVLVFGVAIIASNVDGAGDSSSYPYSQLIAEAAAGRVQSITQDGLTLSVTMTDRLEQTVIVPSDAVNVYAEVCAASGAELADCEIRYEARAPSETGSLISLLITALLPVLLIGTFIYFMQRRAQQAQS